MFDVHIHQLRKGIGRPCFVFPLHKIRFPAVAAASAVRAGDLHIRQKLDVQADGARAVADGTAEFSRIIGKISRLIAFLLRPGKPGKNFPQLIVDIGI